MMLLTKDNPEAEGTETHFDVDSRQYLWRTEHEEDYRFICHPNMKRF